MYRSVSTNRFTDRYSDDHYSYYSSSSSPSSKVSTALRALSLETNELPVYEPISESAKKEKARTRFAEKAVHLIPLVLFLCGFILWIFSNPNIDLKKGNSLAAAANVEGIRIEAGELDSDGTGHLPAVDLGDIVDPTKIGHDANNLLI